MAKQMLRAGLAMIFFWPLTPLSAQPTSGSQSSRTVERTVSVDSGVSARVGVYANVKKNCTSGPLPIVRVTGQPHDGRLTVKQAKVRISGGGACPVAEVPGLIARYQSRPGFSGEDKVTIEVKRPDDEEAISSQTITIDVKPASQTRRSGTTNVNPTAAPQAPNVIPTVAPNMPNLNQTAVPNVRNENTEEVTESPRRPNDVDAAEEIPH